MKILFFAILICFTFQGSAQDTLSFDYHIQTDGHDVFYRSPALVIVEQKRIFIQLEKVEAWRFIVDRHPALEGGEVFVFPNGDYLKLTHNFMEQVDGAFLMSRGESFFLGKCRDARDEFGWTNKTKVKHE